jgi:aminoglycoside 6'-N-acetyltransferase I
MIGGAGWRRNAESVPQTRVLPGAATRPVRSLHGLRAARVATIAAMECRIRAMGPADRAVWAAMRSQLWPDETRDGHLAMIDEILASDAAWGFIAEVAGNAAGFAELAIRNYANGCETRPVPFLEGIWVEARLRRRGIGARLLAHIEAFVGARGFREIGSDALVDDRASHAAHAAWGFTETERVVYFRKSLPVSGS